MCGERISRYLEISHFTDYRRAFCILISPNYPSDEQKKQQRYEPPRDSETTDDFSHFSRHRYCVSLDRDRDRFRSHRAGVVYRRESVGFFRAVPPVRQATRSEFPREIAYPFSLSFSFCLKYLFPVSSLGPYPFHPFYGKRPTYWRASKPWKSRNVHTHSLRARLRRGDEPKGVIMSRKSEDGILNLRAILITFISMRTRRVKSIGLEYWKFARPR